ncbi:MAG: sulfite exporter TauE/SafE family protein [Phycisphaerae bacterium]|nr:sulfite exporter TauE/SafE family protein [Phycisphaerae bacterium]
MPEWLTVQLVLALLGIGLGAGLVGGMLGVGGGIVMIPAMWFVLGDQKFGPESFHLFKLGAIATSAVLSVPAIMRHRRAGAIVPSIARGMIPLALVGVLLGVALSSLFVREQTLLLRRIFGGFLELVAALNLYQSWAQAGDERSLRDHCPVGWRARVYGPLAGFPAGVIAGLLGIGGGVWAVPAQRMALGVRLRNAIANSAVVILPVSITTALMQSVAISRMTTLQDGAWPGFLLAACLAPGAMLGAWRGAGLTHRLPVRQLRVAFQVLLAIAGLRLMLA